LPGTATPPDLPGEIGHQERPWRWGNQLDTSCNRRPTVHGHYRGPAEPLDPGPEFDNIGTRDRGLVLAEESVAPGSSTCS
jgi:hypothetical protein